MKNKLISWWHETDSIEMFLFACIYGFIGWSIYHVVIGLIERFTV